MKHKPVAADTAPWEHHHRTAWTLDQRDSCVGPEVLEEEVHQGGRPAGGWRCLLPLFAKYLCLLHKAPSKSPNCIPVSVSVKANSSSEQFHITSLTFYRDMCAEGPSHPIQEHSVPSVAALMRGRAKQPWESARALLQLPILPQEPGKGS